MASVIPFFKEKRLSPAWNFDAGSLIWRIYFTINNLIIGEVRNRESKMTHFFCVNALTGNALWNNLSFDEPWWIGIEAVYKQWMILHGFVRPDIPEHRGIRVVDITSGKLLWQNNDCSYWFMNDDTLVAHRYLFEKHVAYALNVKTGELINEYAESQDWMMEVRNRLPDQNAAGSEDVVFPEVLEREAEIGSLHSVIQEVTGGRALEGWIEYLVQREILMVSHYQQDQKQSEPLRLNNILTVYDLNRRKSLHREVIAQEVKSPSPGTFFLKQDLLLFIKHQSILTALRLWKS